MCQGEEYATYTEKFIFILLSGRFNPAMHFVCNLWKTMCAGNTNTVNFTVGHARAGYPSNTRNTGNH